MNTADEELVAQKVCNFYSIFDLVFHCLFAFFQESVLKTKVNWKAFEGTYLNPEQTLAIVNYDVADREGRIRLLNENPGYASIFCILVSNLKQPDHLKYVLVLLEELIEDFPLEQRRVRLDGFVRLSQKDGHLPVGPFAALLDMHDAYLQYLAAALAGTFVASESDDKDRGKEAELILRWALTKLKPSEVRETKAVGKETSKPPLLSVEG